MTDCKSIGSGTGKHSGIVSPIRYDDIIQPLTARNIDTTQGRLDYDYDRHCVDISDSTQIGRASDRIQWEYQIGHKFKLDGWFHFHLHWLQNSANIPNWWMQWRIHKHFEEPREWTGVKLEVEEAHPYDGETDFLQISSFPYIDFVLDADGGLTVSDFVDIRLTRDTNNASGLFTGNDPLNGDASLKGADPHLEIDSAGSRLEWEK